MPINYIDLDGEKVSQAEYCRRLGYSYPAVQGIMHRHNVSFEEAIEEYSKPKKERKWAKKPYRDKRLYIIWRGMMNRCYNQKHKAYVNYGGRKPNPIKVCERWHNYFNFEEDMYDSYIKHCEEFGVAQTTIDRHPNKLGNYEPSNTRWATYKEQNNNLTTNHMVTNELNCTQFAEKYNISPSTLLYRLNAGWSLEDIINIPPTELNDIISPTGETLHELSKRLGIPHKTLYARYRDGWDWERILTTPLRKLSETIYAPTGETIPQLAKKWGISEQTIHRRLEDGYTWEEIEKKPFKLYTVNTGESLKELSERLNLPESTVRNRYNRGWTLEEIENTPLGGHRQKK